MFVHIVESVQAAQTAHDPASLEVAVAAAILGLGQFLTWFSNRRTGRHRDRARSAHEIHVANELRKATQEFEGLRTEIRANTAELHRRVDTAFMMLTGSPDGDGPNGHRSTLGDHEKRLRQLERPLSPADVGTYTPRRA